MTVTANDIINNAPAIASLINGASSKTIADLDTVTSLSASDLLHVSVSGVDKNITQGNLLSAVVTTQDITIQVLIGGNLYTGTDILGVAIRTPAMTVTKVRLGARTAPTGSVVTVDLNYHATDPDSAATIFSSNPSIAATAHTGESTSFSTSTFADGGFLLIDIDAVGSSTPGTGLTIEIIGTLT